MVKANTPSLAAMLLIVALAALYALRIRSLGAPEATLPILAGGGAIAVLVVGSFRLFRSTWVRIGTATGLAAGIGITATQLDTGIFNDHEGPLVLAAMLGAVALPSWALGVLLGLLTEAAVGKARSRRQPSQ